MYRLLLVLLFAWVGVGTIQARELSITAQTPGLTTEQAEVYLPLEEKIRDQFAAKIRGSQGEDSRYYMNELSRFRSVWASILQLQVRINEAGTAIESQTAKDQLSYKEAYLDYLRRYLGQLVPSWAGVISLVEKNELDVAIPPLNSAPWVWETSPVIQQMIQGYFPPQPVE